VKTDLSYILPPYIIAAAKVINLWAIKAKDMPKNRSGMLFAISKAENDSCIKLKKDYGIC